MKDTRFVPRGTGPMCCHGTSQASREGYNIRSTKDGTDVVMGQARPPVKDTIFVPRGTGPMLSRDKPSNITFVYSLCMDKHLNVIGDY